MDKREITALDQLNRLIDDLTVAMHKADMETALQLNEVLTRLEVTAIRLAKIVEDT